MKTLNILLLATFLLTINLNAQIRKGLFLVGTSTNLFGSINQFGGGGIANNAGIQFGTIKNKIADKNGKVISESERSIKSFNISPALGYFISDRLLLGTTAGLFIYRSKSKSTNNESGFDAYSISPFLRGYLMKEGKVLPYLEIRGGITSMKSVGRDSESNLFFGGKFGASFFLNNSISLDLFADYIYAKDEEELTTISVTESNGYISFGVGFNFFLFKEQ